MEQPKSYIKTKNFPRPLIGGPKANNKAIIVTMETYLQNEIENALKKSNFIHNISVKINYKY